MTPDPRATHRLSFHARRVDAEGASEWRLYTCTVDDCTARELIEADRDSRLPMLLARMLRDPDRLRSFAVHRRTDDEGAYRRVQATPSEADDITEIYGAELRQLWTTVGASIAAVRYSPETPAQETE